MVITQIRLQFLKLLLNEVSITNRCNCFTDYIKNLKHWHAFELIWFKLGMMIGTTSHYFASGVSDHDLDSRTQVCEKGKTSASVRFDGIWFSVETC